ncbi:M28 family peptidase [Chitinophaga pendula]|uniref:M28 family peptidase n=1 Tax=Chitinophaga TaxID=79328 RepID=UPI000BAE6D35|nr:MULTISPECIES: M28 family peptidase [Chitinophaga]ASZ10882.1 peptidase M28 [Chitinophaga sp. MD30]UCJ06135.1 M28 family peptidase [Chitinophaga pendula]
MNVHKSLLILCLGTLSLPVAAQKKIERSEVSRIIRTLAADDMEGRKAGTAGSERAAAFISKEFAKAGLQPLPGAANYRQEFSRYNATATATALQINGNTVPAEGNIIAYSKDSVISWNADSRIAITRISATDDFQARLRQLRKETRNTLVWVDAAHKELFTKMNARPRKTWLQEEGNAASLILVLQPADITQIDNWSLSLQCRTGSERLTNVTGMIKGAVHPDEYVIFSAHYDHLGIIKPSAELDSIANGADDDASGTTAVMLLAKYYSKKKPARSLLFVAFTAEEIDGAGSRYFSQQLDPEKIVAMFNIEMIGKQSKFGGNSAFITGFERSDLGPILQRNLQNTNFRFHPDPYPDQNLFYRSDNATLAALGVPAHTISTTQIDKDKLYHSVDDEWETLDAENIRSIIEAIAWSARSIVDGKDTPSRIPPLNK